MAFEDRNWLAFDYKSWDIVVSPTQVELANDCMRKWVFKKVFRLKEPSKHFTKLGDVFHQCAERWLAADNNNRTPDGKEVDPHPEGWDETVTTGQAVIIRSLLKACTDEGVIRRPPGLQIEKAYQMEVLGDNKASMIMFADVWSDLGIEDHKTSKDKKWLKSREKLRNCIQMMSYAAAWVDDMLDRDQELPETIELRHNQAITDPDKPHVRDTSVEVPMGEIADFWNDKVIPLVKTMLHWKQAGLSTSAWAKVPGPTTKGVCRKYGGCPYENICGRVQTVEQYQSNLLLQSTTEAEKAQRAETMSDDLLAKMAARKKARASAGVTPSAEKVELPKTEAKVEKPKAAAVTAKKLKTVAPWAQDDCKACSGSGINTEGAVCIACSVQAAEEGIEVDDYTLTAVDGAIQVGRGKKILAEVPFTPPAEVSSKSTPTPAEIDKAAPDKTKEPVPKNATKAKAKKKAFTMLYGLPKRHTGKVIDLSLVLAEQGAELAEALNGSSYYGLNTWERREHLASKAAEIAETLGTALVIVTGNQGDLSSLAAALEPFATNVYGQIAQ